MKTPPMHPQSNSLAEHMVQTLKKTATVWDKSKELFDTFLARFLLNYRSIPHVGRSQSPSHLMGRQIRNPLTFKYPIHAPIWFAPTAKAPTEEATYLAQKGNNTAYILRQNGNVSLAHEDQMRSREVYSQLEQSSELSCSDDTYLQSSQPTEFVLPQEGHPTLDSNNRQPNVETQHSEQVERRHPSTPLAIGPRRSQRTNFGVPPIRWGHVES